MQHLVEGDVYFYVVILSLVPMLVNPKFAKVKLHRNSLKVILKAVCNGVMLFRHLYNIHQHNLYNTCFFVAIKLN